LRPLKKQGVINSVQSVINCKENLYYPVNQENEDSVSILSLTEDCRIIINTQLKEKNVLEESFRTLLERRSNGYGVKYKIIDIDGSEMSLTDLLEIYFFSENHHTSCSIIETKHYNNYIEESSIVDAKSGVPEEDGNTGQNSKDSENNFIDDSKDTALSSDSCSRYGYTIEDIEKFFTSDFEYHKEHSLEDCICRSLIGRQDHHPFLYFLKDDPDVVNIYLESIEHHI